MSFRDILFNDFGEENCRFQRFDARVEDQPFEGDNRINRIVINRTKLNKLCSPLLTILDSCVGDESGSRLKKVLNSKERKRGR